MTHYFVMLASISSLCYLAAFTVLLKKESLQKSLFILVLAGFVLQSFLLLSHWQMFLKSTSLGYVVLFFSWCFVILSLWAYYVHKHKIMFKLTLLSTIFFMWSPLLLENQKMIEDSWGLRLHIIFSVASYAVLAFAAINGALFLLQSKRLKKAKNMFGINLSLNSLQKIMINFSLLGLVLLTIALVSGLLFIGGDIFSQTNTNFKFIVSGVAWLTLSFMFVGYHFYHFKVKPFAVWLLAVNVGLLTAYLGSVMIFSI